MEEWTSPILTNIDSTSLECTLHSSKYHCLLRLRSDRSEREDASNDGSPSAAVGSSSKHQNVSPALAVPDISSLCVIPIHDRVGANGDRRGKSSISFGERFGRTGRAKTEDNAVILLPKLFDATHRTDPLRTDNDEPPDFGGNEVSCAMKTHPAYEIVRICLDMEVSIKERLRDASDGAMHGSDCDKSSEPAHPCEIQEEFLLRSEAIVQELLSTVKQQLRKRKSPSRWSSVGMHSKRHRATEMGSTLEPLAPSKTPPPLKYYSALVRQLQTLQSMNVTEVSLGKDSSRSDAISDQSKSGDLTNLSVTCLDSNKRTHTWHAELYPSIVLTVDLPCDFVMEDRRVWLEKWWEDGESASNFPSCGEDASSHGTAITSAIPRIQYHFEQALEKYQPLFNELDDLDSHLWILEPSLPARRCAIERRIALWEGGSSMVIMLDAENPRGIPVMVRLLGVTLATMTAVARAASGAGIDANAPSGGVVDWRTSFAEFVSEEGQRQGKINHQSPSGGKTTNSRKWSEDRSVRSNLESWFGSPLPSPLSPSAEKSAYLVECGICYAHRLPTEDANSEEDNLEDGPIPEAKCGNPSCSRHYHESCLFEWLHSLPTARVSFDRIFGSCPYCCEAISVKVLNGTTNGH